MTIIIHGSEVINSRDNEVRQTLYQTSVNKLFNNDIGTVGLNSVAFEAKNEYQKLSIQFSNSSLIT